MIMASSVAFVSELPIAPRMSRTTSQRFVEVSPPELTALRAQRMFPNHRLSIVSLVVPPPCAAVKNRFATARQASLDRKRASSGGMGVHKERGVLRRVDVRIGYA
jgi:hypothetical protein